MADGLRWWVIPGALVVLLGVLTLVGDRGSPAGDASGPESLPETVIARDAAGRRQLLTLGDQIERALVLRFSQKLAQQRVDMKIWRRLEGGREAQPWLTLRPRVRADGTIPMAGLLAGRYDIEVRAANGTRLVADDVAVPGSCTFAATPGR